jgi:hypothetical protein
MGWLLRREMGSLEKGDLGIYIERQKLEETVEKMYSHLKKAFGNVSK